MKCTQCFLLWLLYFASFCVQDTSQGAAIATNSTGGPQGQREVRTTAYTRSRHGKAKNANGFQLKAGDLNSAAADWSRFPLGTKFNICGTHQTYVVDDYGPALVGTNNIDLYMPLRRNMHHWGVRKVTINIIEPGSYERSLALLKPRKHVPYVRRMVKVLEKKCSRIEGRDLANDQKIKQHPVELTDSPAYSFVFVRSAQDRQVGFSDLLQIGASTSFAYT